MNILNTLCGNGCHGKNKDLYLRHAGRGAKVNYELTDFFTEKVEWVSAETDEEGNPAAVRVPNESTLEYSRNRPFSMAGKTYPDLILILD